MKTLVVLPPLVNERIKRGRTMLVIDGGMATLRDARFNIITRATGATPEEAIANLEEELYRQEKTK